ncbi:MAG: flavodoxin family protein [Candidatus Omnitrophica bacterium]|nr:flavodoxin family protein [Candidatus Omnitrophota bacterium]MBU1808115.1 flavodoxin family protein [Candidatus Omnitrophota bacterium]
MKVVGISGSPRRSGNSEILLDRALEGAMSTGADVEKIVLNELDIRSCQECGGCDKAGVCVIADGMGHLYKTLDKADAIIVSSPVFFASLSAQTKMMIDRFQCEWMAKYMLKKAMRKKRRKGLFICVAGSHRNDHFDNARSVIKAFFATLDIEYCSELFCGGIEKMRDVDNEEKALNKAYALGMKLVKL